MGEFVGSVLGVGDLGAGVLVVLFPAPLLTLFRLVNGELVGVLEKVRGRPLTQ